MQDSPLKAPFPYFGGKSRVADRVWELLGDPDNFVEPFAGSLAVLLRRPNVGKTETINDANHFVANFWRAVAADPDAVARFADWPVSEADLHARHRWLMRSERASAFQEQFSRDPEYFDARFAGWWCWGACCWIGGAFCTPKRWSHKAVPELMADPGVRANDHADEEKRWGAYGRGVNGNAGQSQQIPLLRGGGGAGVTSIGAAGTCEDRATFIRNWMRSLSDRLRLVRVCYGDWYRICNSPTTMTSLGSVGAFLDPPYALDLERLEAWKRHLRGEGTAPEGTAAATNRKSGLYANDGSQDVDRLVADVNAWCRKWGADPAVRIVLAGYEGEHDDLLELGWNVVEWKANGGYANRAGGDNVNAKRERLWTSPACVQKPKELLLFDEAEA